MPNDNTNQQSDSDQGLINASILDGKGGGRLVFWHDIENTEPTSGLLWMHLDHAHERVQDWLEQRSGLNEIPVQALLSEDPRPRSASFEKGLLLVLRGINLNSGAEPEDMVSLRIWMEPNRIITLRNRKSMVATDIKLRLENRCGPKNTQEFLIQIIECLINRIAEVILDIQEKVDVLEERVIGTDNSALRKEIANLRRDVISLRRYLAPQKDALNRLITEPVQWMDELTRMHLREFSDRLAKFLEDLDAARDRATVTQEELNSKNAEKMNRAMYLISIFTVVFLPLGLLTGLLGINVGGIPGVNNSSAFWIVCLIMLALLGLQLWFFKRNKWF